MNTIAPHLAVATILVAGHIGHARASAAARAAPQITGGITLLALVLGVAVLAAVASAARGLAVLLSEFVRLAAAMMSTLFIMAIAAVAVVALLLHR